jgi:prepilin-type N-terminal cleavage/methylation domain-containing protein
MNKNAFTLAETLIAIGIIGVVSALTIPTLIKNYQKRVIEVNLKKTYAEIQNVIKQSEADNGSFEGWDYSLSHAYGNGGFVNTYFQPYMHLEPCRNNCIIKSGLDGSRAWPYGTPYYTKDGRLIYINWSDDQPRKQHELTFAIDVNGPVGRRVVGQDVFFITVILYNNGYQAIEMTEFPDRRPSQWSDSTIQTLCLNKSDYGQYCGEWIRRNGWKFPKNYPFEIGVKSE